MRDTALKRTKQDKNYFDFPSHAGDEQIDIHVALLGVELKPNR